MTRDTGTGPRARDDASAAMRARDDAERREGGIARKRVDDRERARDRDRDVRDARRRRTRARGSCPAVCAHRLAVDGDGAGAGDGDGDGDASAVIRWTTLRGRGIACADVDVSVSEEGALVVAHPSESKRRDARTPTSQRVGGDVRARFGEGGEEGGEEGWLSLELKGDAFRAESYAEIDAMAGEAARGSGKERRVFGR